MLGSRDDDWPVLEPEVHEGRMRGIRDEDCRRSVHAEDVHKMNIEDTIGGTKKSCVVQANENRRNWYEIIDM